jgi:hypothetical protein
MTHKKNNDILIQLIEKKKIFSLADFILIFN